MKPIFPIRPFIAAAEMHVLPCGFLLCIPLLLLISCGPPPPQNVGKTKKSATVAPSANTPAAEQLDTVHFLNRLSNLSHLARYRPQERTILRSSHDPNEGPDDADHFKGEYILSGKKWNVLLDEEGSGCVTRLWMSGRAQGRLQFFFDHEEQPRIDTTIQQFFGGDYIRSATYLIYASNSSGRGMVSYFPLPFQKRCTILTDTATTNFKYQINVLKLDPASPVISYPSKWDEAIETAFNKVNAYIGNLAFVRYESVPKTQIGPLKIAPKGRKLVANLEGPAAIDYFQLSLKPITAETVKNLKLQVYWNDLTEPAVDCSVSSFFCYNNLNLEMWNSLPLGFWGEKNLFYCQFYMPFERNAQIFLVNDSETETEVTFEYHQVFHTWNDRSLYFYTRTHQRDFIMGFTYPFLEMEGRGNFVGFHLLSASEMIDPQFFYLDGDEYFYVDGESHPSWAGTGEDNYFNGEDYFYEVSHFYVPTHGCLMRTAEAGGLTHCFRFHLLDSIPFHTSLLLLKEIGCPVRYLSLHTEKVVQTQQDWTCYWYAKPAQEPVSRQESVYYFAIDQNEHGRPSTDSPVMRDLSIRVKLPPGDWWFHIAPIWNPDQVENIQKIVPEM
ncbi:MAG: DUF2961 domain-containing protein [Candidatus Omnitrophota bacterium]|jgi:hypothetical protein|nr:MAG: DUF2961 domain-containing protein [Candidatus Omnitrophota bacterium]